MKNISYWLDKPYEARPALSLAIETDVVIIGGGITGVSAAYHCAKRGLKTVLIEKNILASGAAGKNGGMVVEGFSVPLAAAVEQMGRERAREGWQKTVEARKLVQSLIQEHSIDCDFSQPGSLLLARTPSEEEFLRIEAAARTSADISTDIIAAGTQLQKSPFGLALCNRADCAMDPVAFVRGLALAAEGYGATIYEQSPAQHFDAHSVTTPEGTIAAKSVVLALEASHAFLDSDVVTVTTEQAIVTEPLSDEQIAALDWRIGGMFWTLGEDYYNIRKIGSRLFTSGRIAADATEADLAMHRAELLRIIRERLPSLAEETLAISHWWIGETVKSEHEWPVIREREGVHEIFGNGDFGFTNGIMAGKLIAESFSIYG